MSSEDDDFVEVENTFFSEDELSALEKVLQEVEWVGAAEFARLSDEEEAAFMSFRTKLSGALGKRTHHE